MSRFLPLLIFVLWMASPAAPLPAVGAHFRPIGEHVQMMDWWWSFGVFASVYVMLIGLMGLWSRQVARRVHFGDIQNRLRRFNQVMYGARLFVPAWFGFGIYLLGWKALVAAGFAHTPVSRWEMDVPGLIVGTLPAFLAWMGLWWSQYPADFALREQNILIQLNDDLPVHTPPSFWAYFGVNFRLQILFSIAPVLVLMLIRDFLGVILPPIFHQIPILRDQQTLIEACISLPSAVAILLLGPEILRRVLHTESMPDSPLRQRLEAVCQQHNVRFRDVLLWHTKHQMGNAAVMGFVPRFRYFLMSDLLLETMSDEQIEAVFAHEIGHIMHRHLFWLMATVAGLMLVLSGPGQLVADQLTQLNHYKWFPETAQLVLLLGAALGIFSLVFGYVSRKFERQADVFAARTLQSLHDAQVAQSELAATGTTGMNAAGNAVSIPVFPRIAEASLHAASGQTYVGRYGARLFCSALERVATVNNIPVAARSWCHGSIAKRMRFLFDLGRDPVRTSHFDRFMSRLYLILLVMLCVFGAWTMATLWRQGAFAGSSAADATVTAQIR
jgi:STE24 endopeptidase